MIKGIGIDLVEMSRIQRIKQRSQFIQRILSKEEQELYASLTHPQRQLEFLAGRFAVKEAYSKALGTGIGPIGFKDIVVLNDVKGKPYVKGVDRCHVSLSHSEHYCVAVVILEEE